MGETVAFCARFFFTFVITLPVLAQTGALGHRDSQPKLSCPDPQASIACGSFQELYAAKDTDLMSAFGREGHVYICFRQKEDVFFVLWHSEPNKQNWEKEPSRFKQDGTAEFQRFQHGVYEHGVESAYAHGLWWASSRTTSLDPIFEAKSVSEGAPKDDDGYIKIEGGTLTISHSFKNEENGITHYTFQVQRSTGRFTETFAGRAESGKQWESENVGRCLVFK